MLKPLLWVSVAAFMITLGTVAEAGESKFRFSLILKDHATNESNVDSNGFPLPNSTLPPGSTPIDPNDPGARPVGDATSGRMSGTLNTIPTEIAKLIEVNSGSIIDNLAGYLVTVKFKDTFDVSVNTKPVGNLDPISGFADKKGEVFANFQGKLINKGKKFKFIASGLNLQQILAIPPPLEVTGVTEGSTLLMVEISAKGIHPVTGNEINVTLARDLVKFDYVVSTRIGEVIEIVIANSIATPVKTQGITFSRAVGKGSGTPIPVAAAE